MKSYFYRPVTFYVVLLVLFFLIGLMAGEIQDSSYLLGSLLFTALIGTVLSLIVGLWKKATSKIESALPPAPLATAPKSIFFQSYGVFTEVVGVLIVLFGFMSGLLFAGLGGGEFSVTWFLLFAGGGTALVIYGHGIRRQHNWIIPIWILSVVLQAGLRIADVLSDKPLLGAASKIPDSPALYAAGFGGLAFSILIVYKLYEHRNAFSGRYVSIGLILFLIAFSVFAYAYSVIFLAPSV